MSKRSRDCNSGVSQDMIPTYLGLEEAPSLAESNSIGHQVRFFCFDAIRSPVY